MTVAANAVNKFIVRAIFLATLAKAVVLVQAVGANINALTVAVNHVESFAAMFLALLTEFVFVRVATGTVETFGSFIAAGNAQAISTDLKRLEVVSMIGANRNFSIEVGVAPISIPAKALALAKVDAVFVAAIFFGLPEIGDAFKLGKFALNKVAIKLGFGLSPTSAAARVVKAALKQESVEGFVHEELPRSFTVVDSFGLVRVRGSENDEGHVVASIAGATTVIVTIDDVERVARSHGGAALVSFRI